MGGMETWEGQCGRRRPTVFGVASVHPPAGTRSQWVLVAVEAGVRRRSRPVALVDSAVWVAGQCYQPHGPMSS